jgi:hypothetical protein
MALPTSRNTTYTPASPIKSNDLNAIQDCIIGAKHGDVVLSLPGCAAAASANVSVSGGKASSTGAANIQIAIPMLQGCRLKSVTFARTGNGTVDMIADIMSQDSVIGSDVPIGTTTVNNVPSANNDTTVTVSSPAALAAHKALYLNVGASEAGLTVCTIQCTYDRL